MERIGPEVQRELGRFGPAAGLGDIVEAWPSVVGEAIARNAWPARLARDGTLHVATGSAAWAFELGLLEGDLLARLRAALGTAAPARLRFAVGRLPEPPAREPQTTAEQRRRPTDAQREEAARLAAGIADDELREAVARAAAESLAAGPTDRPF